MCNVQTLVSKKTLKERKIYIGGKRERKRKMFVVLRERETERKSKRERERFEKREMGVREGNYNKTKQT